MAVGDVNGDGVPDIITGAGPGTLPEIKVFDGRTGTLLRDFFAGFAFNPLFTGGVFVAAGDVNGDGFADIIVGADAGGLPEVKVFSGARAARCCTTSSPTARPSAAACTWRPATSTATASPTSSRPRLRQRRRGPRLQRRDGSLLEDYFAFTPLFTGGGCVAAGDVNGDGRADIIVGAGQGGAPEVKVFDGSTAAVLHDFFAYAPGVGPPACGSGWWTSTAGRICSRRRGRGNWPRSGSWTASRWPSWTTSSPSIPPSAAAPS